MSVHNAEQQITQTVLSWAGVTAHPHRFGGTEYRLGRREIGHIHGNQLVDIPFPTRVGQQLVAEKQAHPHHILPESGWVSVYIRQPHDLDQALALLRHAYDLAVEQQARRSARATAASHPTAGQE